MLAALMTMSALAAALGAAWWSAKKQGENTLQILQEMKEELQHFTSLAQQQLHVQKMMEMRLQWLESSLQDAPSNCSKMQFPGLNAFSWCSLCVVVLTLHAHLQLHWQPF
jgi:Flp pilus assembly protein TadB